MIRIIWWAAIVAGASYMIPVAASAGAFTLGIGLSSPALVVWKGSGVALLALWAAMHARDGYGWLITAILGCGALGDVLLETAGLIAGAAAFAAGHIVALYLYLRHYRTHASFSQRLLAALLVPISVFLGVAAVPADQMVMVGMYAALVGGMAATAWASQFSRYRVGIGAILFLVSDLLIFADMGVSAGPGFFAILIWPLYFAGQALIAWGVVTTLRQRAQ